jgi:hypothetical protein
MLRQRMRQVGEIHFRGLQRDLARFPFSPNAQADDGHANQRNERCRPQRHLAEFVGRSIHLAGFLRTTKNPTHALFISEMNDAMSLNLKQIP